MPYHDINLGKNKSLLTLHTNSNENTLLDTVVSLPYASQSVYGQVLSAGVV